MNPPPSLSAPGSVDMQSPELDPILTQIKGAKVPVLTPSHDCNLSGDAINDCVLTAEQERELDEGVDFFSVQGALARERLLAQS